MKFCTDNGALLCPHCEGNNLHQYKVEVYDGLHLTVHGKDHKAGKGKPSHQVDTDMSGNPGYERNIPFRQQGLRVLFWCEGCEEQTTLTIFHHEGCTFVESVRRV